MSTVTSSSVGDSHDSLSEGGSHGSAHRLRVDISESDGDGGSHGSAHRLRVDVSESDGDGGFGPQAAGRDY